MADRPAIEGIRGLPTTGGAEAGARAQYERERDQWVTQAMSDGFFATPEQAAEKFEEIHGARHATGMGAGRAFDERDVYRKRILGAHDVGRGRELGKHRARAQVSREQALQTLAALGQRAESPELTQLRSQRMGDVLANKFRAVDPRQALGGMAQVGGANAAAMMDAAVREQTAGRARILGGVGALRGSDILRTKLEQDQMARDLAFRVRQEQLGNLWLQMNEADKAAMIGADLGVQAAGAGQPGIGDRLFDVGVGAIGGGISAGLSSLATGKGPQKTPTSFAGTPYDEYWNAEY